MSEPTRYRKRPLEVEAMQLVDELRNHIAVATWIGNHGGSVAMPSVEPCLHIHTPEGKMRADIGDWIIRGVQGEFYPIKASIFRETYEPVEDVDG